MTMMLDILADYLDLEGIKFCRLDGRMNLEQRGEYMDIFKNDASVPVFLVSTRAGGLGINLTSADTVIIYDSDWVIFAPEFKSVGFCAVFHRTQKVQVLGWKLSHVVFRTVS